jgi:hypothetical protein
MVIHGREQLGVVIRSFPLQLQLPAPPGACWSDFLLHALVVDPPERFAGSCADIDRAATVSGHYEVTFWLSSGNGGNMTSIVVNLTRQAKHWTITLAVNGQIQPRAVFACTEGLAPLVRGLVAAEAENATVRPTTDADRAIGPATITVGMPSGRVLTFSLTSMQDALPYLPEGFPG